MMPQTRFINIGINLNIREWPGPKRAFVLLHGLASNSRTWDLVAERLAAAGHRVVAVDQRGNGLSAKPDSGYDFATITADLAALLQTLNLVRPFVVGQSWGGNVTLEFGARYPGRAAGLGFVDGGFIDFQYRPDSSWAAVARDLRPPDLTGVARRAIEQRLAKAHPDWDEAGLEATLANFEILPDGTIRPWLTMERHLAILRAMWEQRPAELYPQVQEPALVCAARDDRNPDWMAVKMKQIEALQSGLTRCEVHWFDQTDHDIHVHRPAALANLFLGTLHNGLWSN